MDSRLELVKRKIRGGLKQILPGHLPDFLIIGAQKCATTSLHYYLSQHPQMVGSRPKEVHFFDIDETYEKGIDWYKHNFPNLKGFRKYKYFESSPSYIYYPQVPSRIASLNSEMKFILILRDPIHRALSAWNMYFDFYKKNQIKKFIESKPGSGKNSLLQLLFKDSKDFPTFKRAIEIELQLIQDGSSNLEPSILRRGLYFDQLSNYLSYFPKDKFCIIGFKDLVTNLEDTLTRVYSFLDVQNFPLKNLNIESRNRREYVNEIDSQELVLLENFYRKSNSDLFEFYGSKINW